MGKDTTAGQLLLVTEEVSGLLAGSLGQKRSDQAKLAAEHGGLASIEMAAVAHILEHIHSLGSRDLFEGMAVRTAAPDVTLRKELDGLSLEARLETVGLPDTGCVTKQRQAA